MKSLISHYGRRGQRSMYDLILDAIDELPKGCWIWPHRKDEQGYGWISIDGEDKRVHVAMYELFVGKIRKGNHIHHNCENPACFNPEHLEQVTPKEHKARHKILALK
jgi:hypothetical protein